VNRIVWSRPRIREGITARCPRAAKQRVRELMSYDKTLHGRAYVNRAKQSKRQITARRAPTTRAYLAHARERTPATGCEVFFLRKQTFRARNGYDDYDVIGKAC
jgi:hypothetical protein